MLCSTATAILTDRRPQRPPPSAVARSSRSMYDFARFTTESGYHLLNFRPSKHIRAKSAQSQNLFKILRPELFPGSTVTPPCNNAYIGRPRSPDLLSLMVVLDFPFALVGFSTGFRLCDPLLRAKGGPVQKHCIHASSNTYPNMLHTRSCGCDVCMATIAWKIQAVRPISARIPARLGPKRFQTAREPPTVLTVHPTAVETLTWPILGCCAPGIPINCRPIAAHPPRTSQNLLKICRRELFPGPVRRMRLT